MSADVPLIEREALRPRRNRISFAPGELLFFLFVLTLGGFLRFYHLGQVVFWGDDPIHQVRNAYQPLSFVLAHNNQTALSTIVVHFLLAFRPVEFMARLGSAIFGVLTIFAVYALGKRFFSRGEATIAATFVAVSPFLIKYSQYARAYALFAFLSLLSLYFFYEGLKGSSKRAWPLYSLCTGLAVYNHLVACLILVGYAAFVGFLWLERRFLVRKRASPPSKDEIQLKKFFLWTAAFLAVDALLYVLNPDVLDFLLGSAQKAVSQPAGYRISLLWINAILKEQIAPYFNIFYGLSLALILIGAVASLKSHFRQTMLFLFYILIPYVAFIAINPRETNYLSAFRFFIFILPVILLMVARGIIVLCRLGASALSRLKIKRSPLFETATAVTLTVLMASGFFANLKPYYTMFWRLNRLQIDPPVADYLRHNVKSDALIYFDEFPMSTLNTIVNPLTKDLRYEDAAAMIRDHVVPRQGENDLLFYNLSWEEFNGFIAGRDVDLWVVTKLDNVGRRALRQELPKHTDIMDAEVGETVVLRIHKPGDSAAEKLLRTSELLVGLPVDALRLKHYHLLAAKAKLMVRDTKEGLAELKAFDEIRLRPSDPLIPRRQFVERILDRIFGLSDSLLFDLDQERLLYEIRSLLFWHGNRLLREGRPDQALSIYLECLKRGNDWNDVFLEKVPLLFEELARRRLSEEEATLCRKAVAMDPRRPEFHFALAKLMGRQGNFISAQEEYGKAFAPVVLASSFARDLEHEPAWAILWENEGAWRLCFLARNETRFSGTLKTTAAFREVKKFGFQNNDLVRFAGGTMSFGISAGPGSTETIAFRIPRSSTLTIDIHVNGESTPRKILLLPGGRVPDRIPFSVSASSRR